MTQVVELGPHTKLTPEECLTQTSRMTLQDVIVLGYNEDGELVIRSSAMSRKDALWLLETAKLDLFDID